MINLLQVQDDLKNFSEDQLIKEMQQPSGSAPQFLILSELNRRKRVRGDFQARQAQTQPTVAQEVVSSAGVPESGMMGMSEAMAPASIESGGIGSMMPKTMKNGGQIEKDDDYGLAEGGVIRAANGFAGTGSSSQQILDRMEEKDKAKINVDDDVENISEDVTTDTTTKAGTNVSNYTIQPDLSSLTTDSVEQDIINLQKGLQKERALDRALAIAQAGFGIMSSDAPTLGQAVGEGATKGLEAFRESNKRYQEGVVDLINARAKIAAGRKKGKLTASDIMTNLNKTREQLYGKPGDLAYVEPNLDPDVKNRLEAQERYLITLLEDYGVNLPMASAIS